MITPTDIAPIAGTVGGGFFGGMLVGYAIKKVIKLAAVIIGLFIAALAYFEFQHVINVDWNKVQGISQNGLSWITNAVTQISNTIGAPHSETLSHVGIPLASSASAGLMLGLAKG
jgi:uncharacterized membrane protein (Fun14 family)